MMKGLLLAWKHPKEFFFCVNLSIEAFLNENFINQVRTSRFNVHKKKSDRVVKNASIAAISMHFIVISKISAC